MNRDLSRWPRLAIAAAAVLGLGVGVAGTAVIVGLTDGDGPPRATGPVDLVSYDSCGNALNELRSTALAHVGPYGIGSEFGTGLVPDVGVAGAPGVAEQEAAPNAAGAGRADSGGGAEKRSGEPAAQPDHSTTNTHESDVDEPDLVKTDGHRVVSIADGVLRSVDVASRRQTVRLELPSGFATQLLIDGDRALVFSSSGGIAEPGPGPALPPVVPGRVRPGAAPNEPAPSKPEPRNTLPTQLVLVDLTGSGKVLGTLGVDGDYVDARQVGSVARVVVRSGPRFHFVAPDGVRTPQDAVMANREIVSRSSISDWLPRYQLAAGGRTTEGQLVDCASVSHPERYTGTAMLTVLSIDLSRELGRGDPVSIEADGDTVYGTGKSLYIADDHYPHAVAGFAPTERPLPAGSERTDIYQFDISRPGRPVHVASGGIEGSLLNQYSLSEYDGDLRVATTVGMTPKTRSMVSVLTRRGDQLVQVGRIDGLGTGERIYAVRFIDDTAYVVTFRQTDPLYTIDLSDPRKPRLAGQLKITGYSAYLHPVGDGRLLGVGQEATGEGMTTGTQVSLFDTSHPGGAKRLAQYQIPGGRSEAESDPHAFLYWPAKNLVALPMSGMLDSSGQYLAGTVVLRLSGNTLSEAGLVTHRSTRTAGVVAPRRTLVIGNQLWTVSDAGILVSDVNRLTQVAWLEFE